MTFIDLSDVEGMIGLYVEFVADERAECQNDPERLGVVDDLLARLKSMGANLDQIDLPTTIQKLKGLHESVGQEFARDPVMVHLSDLLDEIENAGDI